jgi:hypothetical protein
LRTTLLYTVVMLKNTKTGDTKSLAGQSRVAPEDITTMKANKRWILVLDGKQLNGSHSTYNSARLAASVIRSMTGRRYKVMAA